MNDTIIHRGPDSEGYYENDKIHFGFRRLSIIDVEEGAQPISNEKWRCYNNFQRRNL